MAEDWALDVKKYAPGADDAVIAKIVRYCGIALRSRDASLVSFTNAVETDRVRENYCKKKLALTDADNAIDAAIAAVGARMSGDGTRNRVTVYYLLAEHFGKLSVFGAAAPEEVEAIAVSVPATAEGSRLSDVAPVVVHDAAPAEPVVMHDDKRIAATPVVMRDAHGGSAAGGWGDWVPLAALAIGGAVILSMVGCPKTVPTAVVAPAPIAAVQLPALLTAAPAGADVVESVVDGEPMVSIYFDTAKSDIYPTFAERTAALRAYATSHPADHLQVSGYNDPRGDPAMNAELSKNRAFAVRDALAALGISITTIALVRPSDTTENTESMAQARRVDVTVEDGPVPAEEVEPAAQ